MDILFSPQVLCLVMFLTTCGMLLAGFPVAFTLAGTSALFALFGVLVGVFDWPLLTAFPQRIFSVMNSEVLLAVPLFVFMGVMLERSKIAEDLLEAMGSVFGSVPGGLGYGVLIVGALLAASTGIVGATVVTMGLLSLPTMMKKNYCPRIACGSIAAAGTLGQIIPPSIVLILLGDQLSTAYQQAQFKIGNFSPDTVSVNDLFAGALVPGLLLVVMYLAYLSLTALLAPSKMPRLTRGANNAETRTETWRRLSAVLFAPMALIIAVLGSILAGLATPTEAASVGAVGATILSALRLRPQLKRMLSLGVASFLALLTLANYVDLRFGQSQITGLEMAAIALGIVLTIYVFYCILLSLRVCFLEKDETKDSILITVMRSTMMITSMVFIILVGASMFSLVFRGFGGDEIIETFLHNLPGGAVGALILVMFVMFVLGFFLDFLEIVFIVVPIVAPILLQMEISPGVLMSPVWLGVMMAINLQTSFLTPPFGFALFYLRGVAPKTITTMDIYKGVLPFVGLQILAIFILWFFPELATWLPEKIYD